MISSAYINQLKKLQHKLLLLLVVVFAGCDIVDKEPLPITYNTIAINPDFYSVAQNGEVEISVLGNDSLRGSFTLSMGNVSKGVLTHQRDFTYLYTPKKGYVGTDSLSYLVITNGKEYKGTAYITVERNCSLQAVNDSINLFEGDGVIFDPSFNDSKCGANTSISLIHGNLSGISVATDQQGRVLVNSQPGYYGKQTFQYRLCNEYGDCSIAEIVVNVLPNPACSQLLSAQNDNYNTQGFLILPYEYFLTNDNFCASDVDTSQIQIAGIAAHGTLQINPTFLVYTPDRQTPTPYTETINYTIKSKRFPNRTATAQVRITVQ